MSSRFPWSTAVVTLATSSIALGVVPRASAQSVTALNGSYSGTYRCGQSVTNLALTLTRGEERRVLLIEADLWRPQLHTYLHGEPDTSREIPFSELRRS